MTKIHFHYKKYFLWNSKFYIYMHCLPYSYVQLHLTSVNWRCKLWGIYIETGIQKSKSFNVLKFCETCNWDKSHVVEIEINHQLIMTTIRVNHFVQSRTGRHNKDTTQVICNRSISLPDFKGDLIRMNFQKGPSTSSGHYTSMIYVHDSWYLCNDTNVTVVDFNTFCIWSTVYILFYKR